MKQKDQQQATQIKGEHTPEVYMLNKSHRDSALPTWEEEDALLLKYKDGDVQSLYTLIELLFPLIVGTASRLYQRAPHLWGGLGGMINELIFRVFDKADAYIAQRFHPTEKFQQCAFSMYFYQFMVRDEFRRAASRGKEFQIKHQRFIDKLMQLDHGSWLYPDNNAEERAIESSLDGNGYEELTQWEADIMKLIETGKFPMKSACQEIAKHVFAKDIQLTTPHFKSLQACEDAVIASFNSAKKKLQQYHG